MGCRPLRFAGLSRQPFHCLPRARDHLFYLPRAQCFSTNPLRRNELPNAANPPPPPANFDDEPDYDPAAYASLPKNFGFNQHMQVDDKMKEHLRSLLWAFRTPVRYAFAYGSGVFPQGAKDPTQKPMIDLIFGVRFTQHFHSLNLREHRDHYSFMGTLGSAAITYMQDKVGAGVYFNPYVDINGTMVKYGVVNIDTLCRDLSEWDTLYLAGRLQKPVKILRDDPQVRVANQSNLLSAVRVALLLLPERFSEQTLYSTIAGISYLGDPRMKLFTENPHKVHNIVTNQGPNFRHLYSPLIEQLPNVSFVSQRPRRDEPIVDAMLTQDMVPVPRGNMVRRLPKQFRERLYFQYQRKYQIPTLEFEKTIGVSVDQERMSRRQGGEFEQRIARDRDTIRDEVSRAIKSTISWPSTVQSLKGIITAGPIKSWRYMGEKIQKWRDSKRSKSSSGENKDEK